jgi:hypothetical protein
MMKGIATIAKKGTITKPVAKTTKRVAAEAKKGPATDPIVAQKTTGVELVPNKVSITEEVDKCDSSSESIVGDREQEVAKTGEGEASLADEEQLTGT